MASEPITMTSHREVGIIGGRIGNITEEPVNLSLIGVQPVRVVLGDDSGTSEEIAVVEVMVIVEAVTEVDVNVGSASCIDDTTPGSFVAWQSGVTALEL